MEENVILVVSIVILSALAVVFVICLVKHIGTFFDRSVWEKGAIPDPDAKIVNIQSEKVQYLKDSMKFKTVVTFSDGFQFITHKTARENGFLTYTIAIDRKTQHEITNKAMRMHKKAVTKRTGS